MEKEVEKKQQQQQQNKNETNSNSLQMQAHIKQSNTRRFCVFCSFNNVCYTVFETMTNFSSAECELKPQNWKIHRNGQYKIQTGGKMMEWQMQMQLNGIWSINNWWNKK